MRERTACVLSILVLGCGATPDTGDAVPAPEVPPRGTFCYTLGGGETCFVGDDAVIAARSLDAGLLWFRIGGELSIVLGEGDAASTIEADMTVSGQVSPEATLPAAADAIAIVVPVAARCHRVQLIDPFGTCALRTVDVACMPDLLGPEGEVTVAALDDDAIAGWFRGPLSLDVPSCCAASPGCADPMAWIDPIGLDIAGRFHLGFE